MKKLLFCEENVFIPIKKSLNLINIILLCVMMKRVKIIKRQ